MAQRRDLDAWARLRFAVIGPLLATPPEGRELQQTLRALSRQAWIHPMTGLAVSFGVSTIEKWFYQARRAADPVAALRRKRRSDAGRQRVFSPAVVAAINRLYVEYPGFSVQLHHDNLVAMSELDSALGTVPSYSTLKRHMRSRGLVKKRQPPQDTPGARQALARLEALEVRSYEVEHAFGLWHLDFHEGSRRVLETSGRWIKPKLLGILDDHSRLGCHLQWYRAEDTEALVHGFSQAIAKRGLPRALMSDNGSAMCSAEFTQGLHTLGIVHERTLSHSPYQNGKQENLWATLEGRLMPMISASEELTLDRLNLLTQLWVERDYHQNQHSEIGTTPLARFIQAPSVGRDAPDSETLRRAFRARVTRRQRRSDATVSLEGRRFEIPNRFRHLESVTLGYARWNLARVDLLDPDTGVVLSAVYPQDKSANASGARRALDARADGTPSSDGDRSATLRLPGSGEGLSPLMAKHLRDYIATGVPPGFIPSPGGPTDLDADGDEAP